MPNANVNKVVLGNETLLDLTGDTVMPEDVSLGKTFHLASGAQAVGTSSIEWDTEPTEDSTNGVTSGGVYTALTGKSDTGHTHAADDVVSGTLAAARIPSLDASKIGSGTLDAARIPSLAASKIGSGTVALARGGTASDNTARAINTVFAGPSSGSAGNASWRKLAAADLPTVTVGKGGTNATTAAAARTNLGAAAATWTRLGTFTGTNSLDLDLSDYHEVCIVCYYSTSYMGSIVLPKAAIHATTQRETYLTGSYNGSGTTGRMAACKLSQAKITGIQIRIDSAAHDGNWQVYAR